MNIKALQCTANKVIIRRTEMFPEFYNLWQQVIADIFGLPIEITMTFQEINEPERILQYVIQTRLDEKHSQIFYGKYFLKFSMKEIGNMQNISTSAVSISLHESLFTLSKTENLLLLFDHNTKLLNKLLTSVTMFTEPTLRDMFVKEIESAITNSKLKNSEE